MEIRRKDDKPMVIHTKEKAKIHIRGKTEAKIKGRNVLVVTKRPRIIEGGEAKAASGKKHADIVPSAKGNEKKPLRKQERYGTDREECLYREPERDKKQCARRNQENHLQDSGIRKSLRDNKTNTSGVAGTPGVKTALDQVEGGNELYDPLVTDRLARPITENAIHSGRNLYQRRSEQKIKKKSFGNTAHKIEGERNASEAREGRERKYQRIPSEKTQSSTENTSSKPGNSVGRKNGSGEKSKSAVTMEAAVREKGGNGTGSGRQSMKNFTRNRMIQLFISKIRQEEDQDSAVKTLKDITKMQFMIVMKYAAKYTVLFLAGMFFVVALLALPVIAVLAVIYNSPFAIFFPSISSTETTQNVLTAYMAEFDHEVETELYRSDGHDRSEKVYVDFEGDGIPDNYYDILAVYMVKYGNGDTATDMTDKAKQNLKKVFDDMCSYSISGGTEKETDEDGNDVIYTVKYVNVVLKTYREMIPVYNFNADEQEMLKEMMKPEYLAMIGYEGTDGEQGTDPGQYQAIVDAISDANGKKVVEFALSKVGYPYSNALRDSGTHFDCSSLAYYAWHYAGVNISYHGSTTAASEGQLCYDNNWLVYYDEMQPGDLIFYSYEKNGRFKNISHVAIYTGNGMVVEAANKRLGVVYRPVQGKSSIVMIGRPR